MGNLAGPPGMAKRDGANIATVPVQTRRVLNESTMQSIGPAGISEDDTVNKVRYHQQALSPPLYSPIIQTHYAADARATLESFGFTTLSEASKKSEGVQQIWNLFLLEPILHFDHLCQVRYSETCQPY